MGLGCGAGCAKLILFVFNFVFWLSGLAMLGLGIWLLVDPSGFKVLEIVKVSQSDQLIKIALGVFVGVGAFVFLVGFLGCCGALRENTCMLSTYCGLLVIILIAEITVGVLVAVFKGTIQGKLKENMVEQVKKMYKKNKDALTKAWDAMQYGLNCCGADGPKDYMNSTWRGEMNNTLRVPWTCCVAKDENNKKPESPDPKDERACQNEAANPGTTSQNLYVKGCHKGLDEWLNKHMGIILGVAFGLVALQILGVLLSCCLMRAIKEAKEYATNM